MNQCQECYFKKNLSWTHHIACGNPSDTIIGSAHGIKNGWFSYPFCYDPIWMESVCPNRIEKGNYNLEDQSIYQSLCKVQRALLSNNINMLSDKKEDLELSEYYDDINDLFNIIKKYINFLIEDLNDEKVDKNIVLNELRIISAFFKNCSINEIYEMSEKKIEELLAK